MKPKVYIETTIVSDLTAAPSKDVVQAAHQQLTREWWARRERFDLCISEAVLNEAGLGNRAAADRRIVALYGVPVLAVASEASDLVGRLIRMGAIPVKAATDAIHIAVAV